MKTYSSFKEFYPFYLSQHENSICKLLHAFGTASIIIVIAWSIVSNQFDLLYYLPVIGYGFAWIGHFFFEKNRPATFTYPVYSFLGDWVMFKDILIGKIRI